MTVDGRQVSKLQAKLKSKNAALLDSQQETLQLVASLEVASYIPQHAATVMRVSGEQS